MAATHEIILVAGVLCLLAIFAGLISARVGSPLLLAFIGVGMLAGEDGPGGIMFNDVKAAYLVGSLALAVILFEGGLSTEREMIRQAIWPSIVLATLGVAISATLVGATAKMLLGITWPEALLVGAVTAPTDAAAVSVLLRLSRAKVPSRVMAALEIESGLNDPMSVFLTMGLVVWLTLPGGLRAAPAALLFAEELGGGAAIGLASGYGLLCLFRLLKTESSVFPVFAIGGALAVFGGAQMAGASGFLAVYLSGLIVGIYDHPARQSVTRFFSALGWLAQIALFLMLGLLVNPHNLPSILLSASAIAAVLILVARPIGVLVSVLPFGWPVREAAFIGWVGLRGGVPIYLTIIPLLAGVNLGQLLFDIVFVVVIMSVIVQGSSIAPVARLLKLQADEHPGCPP